ncbi:hypothetical protein [Psychromonas algicola]|uniref:hypothetical protein n=1 Tax=Psychromonas algicola TaxID=2555642 RepID=UPI001068118D|nr:hypothetical protein [Psychromonas sp. RZ5]TEW43028.1 hypothetical protein E2R67_16230 [Psychromonas sp. RZ5]
MLRVGMHSFGFARYGLILARLRSSWPFDIVGFGFRPVGDFTFSWSEEKVSKKTDTESLSYPNNK